MRRACGMSASAGGLYVHDLALSTWPLALSSRTSACSTWPSPCINAPSTRPRTHARLTAGPASALTASPTLPALPAGAKSAPRWCVLVQRCWLHALMQAFLRRSVLCPPWLPASVMLPAQASGLCMPSSLCMHRMDILADSPPPQKHASRPVLLFPQLVAMTAHVGGMSSRHTLPPNAGQRHPAVENINMQ